MIMDDGKAVVVAVAEAVEVEVAVVVTVTRHSLAAGVLVASTAAFTLDNNNTPNTDPPLK